MDKNYLKEHNLLNTQKRFEQICEYTFITSPTLNEEGEDDNVEQNVPQEDNAPMNNGEVDPNQNNQEGVPQGNETFEDMPSEENVDMDGEEIDVDMMGDEVETDMMQPGDEVIDIDDLTQSQQASEIKIDDVDEKLTTLLNVVNKFSVALEQNDQKIMDLKAEIERRNPTEEEKLNLRSQATYPYNVQPKSYWEEKSKNSNYNISYNNEIPTSKENEDDELVFTKKDLKGINDVEVAKSLDDYNQLSDFINF